MLSSPAFICPGMGFRSFAVAAMKAGINKSMPNGKKKVGCFIEPPG
jgi:hypothetical protein